MTQLRKMMLEELQRRNYSNDTIRHHLRAVEEFSRHFATAPDKLGLNELRTYQAYLLKTRKLAVGTVVNHVAALRFFFVRTLKRPEFRDFIPYPKEPERLPTILSLDEVARLINASGNLFRRALLMTVYGTGMRRSEVVRLKVSDIDSQRMIIRVVLGKAAKIAICRLARNCWKPYARTGAGESQRNICSPVAASAEVRTCRSPTRRSGTYAATPRGRPASPNTSPRIPCATVGQRTCSKPAPTCAPSRCCSATEIWRPLHAIFIFRRNTCIPRRIRWRSSSFPK